MQLTARQREFAGIAGWALPVSVTPYCCLATNRSYVQLQTYALRCAPFAGQGRRLPTTRTGGASSGPEPACDNALSSASGIRCSLSQWRRGHREPCSRRWVQSFYLATLAVTGLVGRFGECRLRAINREAHLP